MRFEGKTILVTGGGSGIGAAVARRLASEGAKVVVMGRRAEPLDAVAGEIDGLALAADAADTRQVRAAIVRIGETYGPLDLLVANAGGEGGGALETLSDETWAEAGRANLDTGFVCAREALPGLIERRGNIVFVSSIAGRFAVPEAAGYVTMKHAVIGLGRALARDYGRRGVRTNVVCPGWVATGRADQVIAQFVEQRGLAGLEEGYRLVTRHVPLGRPAQPEEVANAICFLGSQEAAMINGAVLTVDGGAGVVDLPTIAFTA
ncbi:MAG: SDR family oxidoreductase [Rhodospirillales bacterium]